MSSRRKRKQSFFVYKRKDLSPILADNPMDIITVLLILISIFVMQNLYFKYLEDVRFPSISVDSLSLLYKGMIGFILMFAGIIFFSSKGLERRFNSYIGFTFDPSLIEDNDIKLSSHIVEVFFCFASYMVIQAIGFLLRDVNMFQSVAVDVRAFYMSSATIEECLYRGGIMIIVQALVYKVMKLNLRKDQYPFIPGIVATVVSTVFFVFAHERYFSDPVALLVTILGSLSQCFWYLKSKNLLVPMIAHIIVNIIASGGLLQTLGA